MNLLGQEGPFIVLYQDQTTRPDRTSQGHFYFYDVLVIKYQLSRSVCSNSSKIMRINREKKGLIVVCVCDMKKTYACVSWIWQWVLPYMLLKKIFCKVSQKFWVRSSHPFEITIWSNFKYFQSLSLFREAQTYKNIMTESKVFL